MTKPAFTLIVALGALILAIPAAAQEKYEEIPCTESLISREGMKCFKGPEFRDGDGRVHGNYYRITGTVKNLQGFATMQWPSSSSVVNFAADEAVKKILMEAFGQPKRDGSNWSDIKKDGDLRYVTFSLKERSCAAYRKWGPSTTVTASGGRQFSGASYRMDGYFCLPPGETMTIDRLKQLVGEIKYKTS